MRTDVCMSPDGWATGHAHGRPGGLFRDGTAQYVIMIRDPSDPDPIADKKRKTPEYRAIRERWGPQPHLALKKLPPGEIQAALLDALRDHGPCTFNRISCAAFGLTADVVTQDFVLDAWWALVERGVIEHTTAAPILWRVREGA